MMSVRHRLGNAGMAVFKSLAPGPLCGSQQRYVAAHLVKKVYKIIIS